MGSNIITKSNALIESSYRLSLTEVQIILYGISLLNPTEQEVPREYRIDIGRFAEQFNRKHGEIYSDIKDAIKKRFWERDFSYTADDGKIVTCRWLTRIIHEDKTGYIKIKFSEDVQPYLHQLKSNFTSYYIEQVAKFKSVYSVRLYEMAIMNLNRNKTNKAVFKISIQALKNRLELQDKYSRFSNFKKRVLDVSKKEINDHSDIHLSYRIVKEGRTPVEIKFTITKQTLKNNDTDDQLNLKLEFNAPHLPPSAFETAKKLVIDAKTGWDIYAIEQEFYAFVKNKGMPNNVTAAFIGFVKNKIKKRP